VNFTRMGEWNHADDQQRDPWQWLVNKHRARGKNAYYLMVCDDCLPLAEKYWKELGFDYEL
jgi:hypothetical protein